MDQHDRARDQAVDVLEHYNVVVTHNDIFSRCQVIVINAILLILIISNVEIRIVK